MALPGAHRIELAVVVACLCLGLACSGSLGTEGMGTAGRGGSVGGTTGLPTGGGGTQGGVAGSIGAPGGRGGGMVVQGRGGSGPGGTGESCLMVSPPQCPSALCGNGLVDSCMVRAGLGFCPEVIVSEACDGRQLGAQTCQSRGFGSGTLACSAYCELDTTGCSECLSPSATLLRCGAAPVTADPVAVAIAANDVEVALAWIERVPYGPPELWFARLSPSLDLIASVRIDDPAFAAYPDDGYSNFGVSVAPLPSGWVVAGWLNAELFMHALDETGQSVARVTIEPLSIDRLATYPVLAARPGAGPLVTWQTRDALRAALIASDGRSVTAPVDLPVDSPYAENANAAFIGGAFHVVTARETATNPSQLRVFRIAPDGTLAATFEALPGVTAWMPSFVAGADDLRLLYLAANGTDIVWQQLDAGGAARSSPVIIAGSQAFSVGTLRALSFGADTVSLLAGLNTANALGVARVASDGTMATPAYKIADGLSRDWHDAVRLGPELVAAWQVGSRPGIRLARVAP